MKRLFIVFLMMVIVGSLFGAKVVLNNGVVLNGKLRGKSGDKIYLYSESRGYFIGINNDILSKISDDNNNDITENFLERKNFNQDIDFSNCYDYSQLDKSNPKPVQQKVNSQQVAQLPQHHKINPSMLGIGLSLLAISINNFLDARDINDSIDDAEEYGRDTKKLKSSKNRKMLVGTVTGISSIITFRYSFQRVQVQASPTSLSLSYKF